MISRFLILVFLVGTTFAQTATPATAAAEELWPEGKMPGNGAKEAEAEVPRNDGFHRITNVSRLTLTLFPAPRKAGAAAGPSTASNRLSIFLREGIRLRHPAG